MLSVVIIIMLHFTFIADYHFISLSLHSEAGCRTLLYEHYPRSHSDSTKLSSNSSNSTKPEFD